MILKDFSFEYSLKKTLLLLFSFHWRGDPSQSGFFLKKKTKKLVA